jgi:hypothetical protein
MIVDLLAATISCHQIGETSLSHQLLDNSSKPLVTCTFFALFAFFAAKAMI